MEYQLKLEGILDIFFLLQKTGWAILAALRSGHSRSRNSFSLVQSGRSSKLTTNLNIILKIRMSVATILISSTPAYITENSVQIYTGI